MDALYQAGCDLDDGLSCRLLAQQMIEPQGRPPRQPERAFALMSRACELHQAYGCRARATYLIEGTGTAPDREAGLTDGWTIPLPDRSQAQTSCNFNNCATDGWTTALPDGSQMSCSCSFNDCAENAVECG
ncbi:MAG TPA: hypothetical protein VKZ63_08075 [Kofleriaceae bacterium]|nr:hypothetical protein [Kofleriaceae bacterium]